MEGIGSAWWINLRELITNNNYIGLGGLEGIGRAG